MIDALNAAEQRFNDLSEQMAQPDVLSDHHKLQVIARERSELEPLVSLYDRLKKVQSQIQDNQHLAHDPSCDADLKELALAEIDDLKLEEENLNSQIRLLLVPRDPNDSKDVILEVRAGAGGEEAALFAGDLLRLYTRFAERRRWKAEMMSSTSASAGGFREAIISIQGAGAYSVLKFESGVHRVQRVPVTEASGRIHTSTATVAVLPEAEEVEIDIDPKDLEIDTYRASSAGGQHVNKTESAVRIVHVPTGLMVTCQDERSQLQNKERAMRMLRAHLLEQKQREQSEDAARNRKQQVGSGDRSEKIRTYNFPQGRITDHRIGFTAYNLDQFMDGDINDMVEALSNHDQAERLQAASI